MNLAIQTDDLHVNFGKVPILWDVSVKIPKGKIVGILGPNGAGKSTFLKAVLGITKPFSGTVTLDGKLAYVPQRESVDWDFPITAQEVVLMGRYGKLGLFGRLKKADVEAAKFALEQVGMTAFANRQISELSGGQQQRLFIARALVQNPDIFLLDEPFVGIDMATELAIMNILKKQKDEGKTILIVHHDLTSVEDYFDWALMLNTRLHAYGPIDEIFTKENLSKTYGKNQALFDQATALAAKRFSGLV